MTRATSRLNRPGKPPGKLDVLNSRELYENLNLPRLEIHNLPERFVAWPQRKRAEPGDGLHFFTDDYRFEPVWSNVDKYKGHFYGRTVIAPDFSVYPEYPMAMVQWQVYRARWMARALEERGATVIPAVTWTGRADLDYECMRYVPRWSAVAISCYGATRNADGFRRGFEDMVERLEPKCLIVIGGKMPDYVSPWCTRYYQVNHIERVRQRDGR